jgi:uncharacterized protein YecE (DUF72 family)
LPESEVDNFSQDNENGIAPEISPSVPLRPRTWIGCAGWSIPREAARHFSSGPSHLERYARILNACEINSSFYRPHKIETWTRWGESVPAEFRFAVKAPRTITHGSALSCGSELLSPFLRQISILKDKLGPILFQLPPSLEFVPVRVRRFLTLLRNSYEGLVVWEPRHPTWFVKTVDDLLKEFQIARVAADPACVPLAAHPGGLLSPVYFRLHGFPRVYYSPYTDDFLNALAERLTNLPASVEIWCIFDNTAFGAAIPNAVTLNAKMSRKTVLSVS